MTVCGWQYSSHRGQWLYDSVVHTARRLRCCILANMCCQRTALVVVYQWWPAGSHSLACHWLGPSPVMI